jgi:hypothetical protein
MTANDGGRHQTVLERAFYCVQATLSVVIKMICKYNKHTSLDWPHYILAFASSINIFFLKEAKYIKRCTKVTS